MHTNTTASHHLLTQLYYAGERAGCNDLELCKTLPSVSLGTDTFSVRHRAKCLLANTGKQKELLSISVGNILFRQCTS